LCVRTYCECPSVVMFPLIVVAPLTIIATNANEITTASNTE